VGQLGQWREQRDPRASQPNLLDAALPACVGVVSVAASALLWAAVLPALVLRVGKARQAAGPAESWAVRSEGLAASD